MPKVTIDGKECQFKPGQMILQVANENGLAIPQYCYHDGLSIVASCRICLAEVWAPNPRNNNTLEPIPKLVPTCQTACGDGQVVYTNSPKAVQNQKAVMEYLLINHPLDCPVCDQAGECYLQDYSYEYGRGASRFEETKVKNPKKDLGPHVYLYADRCIMCTRCVRFTREVTGTSELLVTGRGNKEEIDIFPGVPLDNELSVNVVDLCPVGALLEKDFLFAQRVWFLKRTPSIDGITASGDNIYVEHNEGVVYRIKPRTSMAVNKWWITDEVRYGWKHVHSEHRLRAPLRRQFGTQVESDWARAYHDAADGLRRSTASSQAGPQHTAHTVGDRHVPKPGAGARRVALMVSPMLSCEEAFVLAEAARAIDPKAILAVGPIPMSGQDRTIPAEKADGFRISAEKAPNSRGVKRVLSAVNGKGNPVIGYEQLLGKLKGGDIAGVILTGNYPSDWGTTELERALEGKFVVLIDTLAGRLSERADVVLPGATWVEKAGTFQNSRDMLQGFEAAIQALHLSRPEGQIGLELRRAAEQRDRAEAAEHGAGETGKSGAGAHSGAANGRSAGNGAALAGATFTATVQGRPAAAGVAGIAGAPRAGGEPDPSSEGGPVSLDVMQVLHTMFNPAAVRQRMAREYREELGAFATDVAAPMVEAAQEPDMVVVDL
jgi:NADH-quinone oxidoreductase subunit G